MDSEAQAEGEQRVMVILFEPLEDLGLGRPTTTTIDGYQKMKRTVCQCLAAKTEPVLCELREWSLAHPGGPNRDRVPIGVHILAQAKRLAPPPSQFTPSPLIDAIFSAQLGRDAIKGGWAPELLGWVRSRPTGEREWPKAWTVTQIKNSACDALRRLEDIEFREGRGAIIDAEDVAFRDRRLAALQKCADIADQAQKVSA